eukprot:712067-Prymnesium_polylepis.1
MVGAWGRPPGRPLVGGCVRVRWSAFAGPPGWGSRLGSGLAAVAVGVRAPAGSSAVRLRTWLGSYCWLGS